MTIPLQKHKAETQPSDGLISRLIWNEFKHTLALLRSIDDPSKTSYSHRQIAQIRECLSQAEKSLGELARIELQGRPPRSPSLPNPPVNPR